MRASSARAGLSPAWPALLSSAVAMTAARPARAELEELDEGIALGAWDFYPWLEVRVRGEYRRHPADGGGDRYAGTAALLDGFASAAPPVVRRDPEVTDQWLVGERVRLGLRVERGVLGAVLALQDARVLGLAPGAPAEAERLGAGTLEPFEAHLRLSDRRDPEPRVRVWLGRQRVRWGEGRLVGESDWAPRAGALDAARVALRLGDFDVEALAALLAPPGALPSAFVAPAIAQPAASAVAPPSAEEQEGAGAQLFGLHGGWQLAAPVRIELTGLARFVRDPVPASLVAGDTYVVDLRVAGEHRGFDYAVEGAVELGRVASYGFNRDVRAFASAARAGMRFAAALAPRVGVFAALASGDASGGSGESITRFDPIVPDVHAHHGAMDAYAWSNLIELGVEASLRPAAELELGIAAIHVDLAEPADRWTTEQLVPVGAAPENEARALGHELDARASWTPWGDHFRLSAGYAVLITGDGAKAVLAAAGRGEPDLLQHAYLQAELRAP